MEISSITGPDIISSVFVPDKPIERVYHQDIIEQQSKHAEQMKEDEKGQLIDRFA